MFLPRRSVQWAIDQEVLRGVWGAAGGHWAIRGARAEVVGVEPFGTSQPELREGLPTSRVAFGCEVWLYAPPHDEPRRIVECEPHVGTGAMSSPGEHLIATVVDPCCCVFQSGHERGSLVRGVPAAQ